MIVRVRVESTVMCGCVEQRNRCVCVGKIKTIVFIYNEMFCFELGHGDIIVIALVLQLYG